MYGAIKGWSRHLIVATGKTDWVRDVEDEKDSVMEAVGKNKDAINKGKLMLSASNIPTPEHMDSEGPYGSNRPTRVLLLPSFQWIDGVTPTLVPDLITSVVNTAPTNTTPITMTKCATTTNGAPGVDQSKSTDVAPEPVASLDLPDGLNMSACPHKYLILLCSQRTRDARCGQTAPLLRKEFERKFMIRIPMLLRR